VKGMERRHIDACEVVDSITGNFVLYIILVVMGKLKKEVHIGLASSLDR
jgi:hypothetical protein